MADEPISLREVDRQLKALWAKIKEDRVELMSQFEEVRSSQRENASQLSRLEGRLDETLTQLDNLLKSGGPRCAAHNNQIENIEKTVDRLDIGFRHFSPAITDLSHLTRNMEELKRTLENVVRDLHEEDRALRREITSLRDEVNDLPAIRSRQTLHDRAIVGAVIGAFSGLSAALWQIIKEAMAK